MSSMSQADRDALAAIQIQKNVERARIDWKFRMEWVYGLKVHSGHEKAHNMWKKTSHLVYSAHRLYGKTACFTIPEICDDLGQNQRMTIGLVNGSDRVLSDQLRGIKDVIENNERYRLLYGNLKPATPQKWTEHEIIIARPKDVPASHPSIWVAATGTGVDNRRARKIYIDDPETYRQAQSVSEREKRWAWTWESLYNTLETDGALAIIGAPQHERSIVARVQKDNDWDRLKIPIIDPKTKLPNWPERFPMEWINARRKKIGDAAFRRQYMLEPVAASDKTFNNWGEVILLDETIEKLLELPQYVIVGGVDPASSKRKGNVITFCLAFPFAGSPDGYLRVPIFAKAGQWSWVTVAKMLAEQTHILKPDTIFVEDNATQDQLINLCNELPGCEVLQGVVQAIFTGSQKMDEQIGLPGMNVEFGRHMWALPKDAWDPDIHDDHCTCDWCRLSGEIDDHPSGVSTDMVMSLQFCREAFRRYLVTSSIELDTDFSNNPYRRTFGIPGNSSRGWEDYRGV